MKQKVTTLLFELIIVFIGVLGAFTSDRIIQKQIEANQNKETLRTLRNEITQDTARLEEEIRSKTLKNKQQLSRKFRIWLRNERIPRDSLQILLDQMTYFQIPLGLVNFKLLQIDQGINQISNLKLKRLLFDYYAESENTEKYYSKISEDNIDAIVRHFDMRDFGDALNPHLRNKFITSSQLDREIVNRTLSYENQIGEIGLVLKIQKSKADTILSVIKRELD